MECPYCKEEIRDGAIKCKHCGSMLATSGGGDGTLTLGELFFSFQGRVTRSTYWLKYYLPYIAIYVLLIGLDVVAGSADTNAGIGIFSGIFALAAIWPSLAISVKRCHDRNRSGWFLLIGLIPIVNFWLLIELGFLRGTEGPNQYGPDPLA